MKRLSVSLPDDLADAIVADAQAGRRSVSAQIVYDLEEVRRRRVKMPAMGVESTAGSPPAAPRASGGRDRRQVEPIPKGGR